jgi:glycosyltransferase involved in cell wall biosynthesis
LNTNERKPYLSIVTPVLDAASTLRATMESVSRQDASFEHVVCDAGSKDGTIAIAREYEGRHPLRIVHLPGVPLYESIARTHETTTGEIMGWLNGDDFYHPGALRTVERVFRECPHIEWLCGVPNQYHTATGVSVVSRRIPVYCRWFIRLGWYRDAYLGYLQQESMFWRRSLYDRADGAGVLRRYDYAGDFHLWRAFARHARLHTVRSVLASFTIREGQLSRARRDHYVRESGPVLQTPPLRIAGRLLHEAVSLVGAPTVIAPHRIGIHRTEKNRA